MKRHISQEQVCDICGKPGARMRRISETHGKGKDLLVIENIPMIRCSHCGESYFTADVLQEIERIKRRRHELAVERPVEVLTLA
jgi:YgiT-type zinc finger domain-containing protein